VNALVFLGNDGEYTPRKKKKKTVLSSMAGIHIISP
jgi:hypothetical protein